MHGRSVFLCKARFIRFGRRTNQVMLPHNGSSFQRAFDNSALLTRRLQKNKKRCTKTKFLHAKFQKQRLFPHTNQSIKTSPIWTLISFSKWSCTIINCAKMNKNRFIWHVQYRHVFASKFQNKSQSAQNFFGVMIFAAAGFDGGGDENTLTKTARWTIRQ